MKKENEGLPVMHVVVDRKKKKATLWHVHKGKKYKRVLKYEEDDEWNSFTTDRMYDIHFYKELYEPMSVSIYPLKPDGRGNMEACTSKWCKVMLVVKKDRKVTPLANSVAVKCLMEYEENGAYHGMVKFGRKFNLMAHDCKGCDTVTATISYKNGRDECAVCGQKKEV